MVRKSFTFEGKRYFIKAKTEREAFEKMALKRRDLEEGRTIISKNTPVSVWAERWFEAYKKNSVSESWGSDIRSIILVKIRKGHAKSATLGVTLNHFCNRKITPEKPGVSIKGRTVYIFAPSGNWK